MNCISYNLIIAFNRFLLYQKKDMWPTRNLDLLSMKPGEKKFARLNNKVQVVYNGKGERLSSYLGTLVQSQHNVPIQVQDWNHVSDDASEKIWALVLVYINYYLSKF